MRKRGYGKIQKICQYCGICFLSRVDRLGKYCSKSCTSKANPPPSTKIFLACLFCGKNFSVKKYRSKTAKFCSIKCLSIVRGFNLRKENHPLWKGGISERSYLSRKFIREKKQLINFCQKCGSQENLEGHHVKGYKNDLENIIILCYQCHAKEHPKLKNFIRKKYDK